jgi:hypothetical protein
MEFHVLLFLVALVLFCRPVLLMLGPEHPRTIVLSFFLPWAGVVGMLFVVSRSYLPVSQAAETKESDAARR